MAAFEVVVDQAHRLHERVDRGRADEASSRASSGPCDSAVDSGVVAIACSAAGVSASAATSRPARSARRSAASEPNSSTQLERAARRC